MAAKKKTTKKLSKTKKMEKTKTLGSFSFGASNPA
jgi:hypothetical protein